MADWLRGCTAGKEKEFQQLMLFLLLLLLKCWKLAVVPLIIEKESIDLDCYLSTPLHELSVNIVIFCSAADKCKQIQD